MKKITRKERIEKLLLDLEELTKEGLTDEQKENQAIITRNVNEYLTERNYQVDLRYIDYFVTLESILKDDPNYESILDLKNGEFIFKTSNKYNQEVYGLLLLIFEPADSLFGVELEEEDLD